MSAIVSLVRTAILGAAFLALVIVGPAAANTVSIYKDDGTTLLGTLSDGGGSITFLGFTAQGTSGIPGPGVPGSTSSTTAIGEVINPANPDVLTTEANKYWGTSFTETNDHRTNGGGSESLVLSIVGQYFSITIDGPTGGTAFFMNNTAGTLSLKYLANASHAKGVGVGVSHYDNFFVPGPIVGAGIPGLVFACAGLIALARRRRKLA